MKTIALPTEDEVYQMTKMTEQVLKETGYQHYEVSNFAKPGYACRHNIGYWERENYLGLGLGAASMVEEVRWSNKRALEEYRETVNNWTGKHHDQEWNVAEQENLNTEQRAMTRLGENVEYLTREEQMEEFMFLGLRLTKGVSRQAFEQKFGVDIEEIYGEVLAKLQQEGLILAKGYIRLTSYGMDISNYAMSQFLLN